MREQKKKLAVMRACWREPRISVAGWGIIVEESDHSIEEIHYQETLIP